MNPNSAMDMINKMKAGIEHQAQTNADAIREQANQDSERLRTRTVYAAKNKIKEENKLTKKQIRAKKSVQISVVNGKQRMKLLQIRDQAIDKALARSEERLAKIVASPDYKDILFKLCIQGLKTLDEVEVSLAVRKCDVELLKGMLDKLVNNYKEQTEKDVKLSISDYIVPDECIGGVVLIACDEKIQISNTLKDRLHLACKDLYPQIRQIFIDNKESA